MEPLEQLGLAMGTAWTSGINLYATVAALGIAQASGLVQLPPGLEVLANPAVIVIAVFMYFVEFFADKVPYVDSGWDAVHTFIRVPAGALGHQREPGAVHELGGEYHGRRRRLRRRLGGIPASVRDARAGARLPGAVDLPGAEDSPGSARAPSEDHRERQGGSRLRAPGSGQGLTSANQ